MVYLVEEEQEFKVWDTYYAEAVNGAGDETSKPDSLWWKGVNEEIFDIVKSEISAFPNPHLLEAGCGAGKSSLDLLERIQNTQLSLMDISPNALSFAKREAAKRNLSGISFTEGSIFNMPYPDKMFDMVWNVGLVEHYSEENIQKIVREMNRVLKNDGCLIIGIPNRYSLAVLKAALLGSPFGRKYLSFISGYRNETEILYSNHRMAKLISDEVRYPVVIKFAGSMLWVGAPEWLIKLLGRLFKGSSFSFITLLIYRKNNKIRGNIC